MNARRLTVSITLWTDAQENAFKNLTNWHRLFQGKNPSWAEMGREPSIRVQGVEVRLGGAPPGEREEEAPAAEEKPEPYTGKVHLAVKGDPLQDDDEWKSRCGAKLDGPNGSSELPDVTCQRCIRLAG